jgi:transcriptional regulator with XRE-family HTH domain
MKNLAGIFEPKDAVEREVFAIEQLVGDVQAEIYAAMRGRGISKSDLAERMGVSKSRISKILGDEAQNVTLATIAKVFNAIGQEVKVVRPEPAIKIGQSGWDWARRRSFSANENWPTEPSELQVAQKRTVRSLKPISDKAVPQSKSWNNNVLNECA